MVPAGSPLRYLTGRPATLSICGYCWWKTEERLARSVARGLGADGFDVDVVHDGLDGLWRAREGSYAAIVLDIMLPGMNGYEVCRTLRSDDIWTPVLFLTAKDGEYDETDGFAMGADDVLAESVRMGQIVEDLLLLSRTDETDGGQYRTVDFDDMVRDEVGRPRSTKVEASGVTPVQVIGDPVALGRLVAHLLDNATRHADEKVQVSLRVTPDGAELLVDDDGGGIPEADRERVFERFTRLDDARTHDTDNTKLSLAMVAATAETHGGRVKATDSSLGGAKLRVVLPLA